MPFQRSVGTRTGRNRRLPPSDYGLAALTLFLRKGMIAPVLAGVRTPAGTGRTPGLPHPAENGLPGLRPLPRGRRPGILTSRFTAMILRRRGADVLVRAPAKVNLFLEVLRRRADGYHELATLMMAVSLYDTLRFRDDPSGSVRLRCDRPDLSAGPDNLVCRAAELLRRRAGRDLGADDPPVEAHPDGGRTGRRLQRRRRDPGRAERPVAAGPEPGRTGRPRRPNWAATCRSSSPPPAAWCTGRGERVEPLALGRPLDFVLVSPPVGLSTAEVFRNVTLPAGPADRRGRPPGRRGRRRGGTRPAAAQPLAGPRPNGSAPKWRTGGNGWPPSGRPAV